MNDDQVILEPPLYFADDHLFDLSFHPGKDILACTLINGWVKILGYNSDAVTDLAVLKHHSQSTRSCSFSPSGVNLATGSKDKSISVIDTNGQVGLHLQNAHTESVNIVKFLSEEMLISGDDNGTVKVWDLRAGSSVYDVSNQSEAITGLAVSPAMDVLISSSLDGTIAAYDIRKPNNSTEKLIGKSVSIEEDITSLQFIKEGAFIACTTSEGAMLLFKHGQFQYAKARVTFHTTSIDHMVKVDENTLIIGGEDGLVRGVSVYPNKQIAVLGQHEDDENFPITKLGLSHCGNFAASLSHDSSIKFYDVSAFIAKSRNAYAVNRCTWEGYDDTDGMYYDPKSNGQMKAKVSNNNDNDDDDFVSDDDDEDDGEGQMKM